MKNEVNELAASTCKENIDSLKQKALNTIMELTEEERIRVLSKYASKYNSLDHSLCPNKALDYISVHSLNL